MTNYTINQERILLPANNGGVITLKITNNSGRIAYRDKINTLIGIKHPGIELGVDQYGYRWLVHHHYKNVRPSIEREDAFSLGEPVFYDNRPVNYCQYTIIERSLSSWWFGTEYHWLWQNCQHFINRITTGEIKSESVDQVSNAALLFGALTGVLGLVTKNSTLTKIGVGIAAGGAIGKGLSRMK